MAVVMVTHPQLKEPASPNTAALTISGPDGNLTVTEQFWSTDFGASTVTIENGGKLSAKTISLAQGFHQSTPSGASSKALLTGSGSAVSAQHLGIGGNIPSELSAGAGTAVSAAQLLMVGGSTGSGVDTVSGEAYTISGSGDLTVSGAGSTLSAGTTMVGLLGKGSLTVADGAQATFKPAENPSPEIAALAPPGLLGLGLILGGPSMTLKDNNASLEATIKTEPSLTVTGAGSKLEVQGPVLISSLPADQMVDAQFNPEQIIGGPVSLTVADGATFQALDAVQIGGPPDITPPVNINIGSGAKAGTLKTAPLEGHGSEINVNFNHTDATSFDAMLAGFINVHHLNTGTTTFNSPAAAHPTAAPFQLYWGDTTISQGTLTAGLAQVLSGRSVHIIEAAGTLDANGFNQSVAKISNAGTLRLPASASSSVSRAAPQSKAASAQPGTTFTVGGSDVVASRSAKAAMVSKADLGTFGDYVSNDGTLVLATTLGADGSPSDKLAVTGAVVMGSGPTQIEILNVNGTGAATTNDGIEVVSVTGDSPAGAFTLKTIPRAGGFIYSLKQVNGNWYLQSAQAQTQTIDFPAQANHPFTAGGTFPVSPAATASSGLPISYNSTTPGVCTVAGSTVTMVSTGICTLTAAQAGDATYDPVDPVPQSFELTAPATGGQPQTISFNAQASQPFVAGGSFPVSPAATASSGLAVSYSSATPAVCTVSGSTVTMVSAGTCTVTAEQAGNEQFAPATAVSQSFQLTTGGTTTGTATPVPTLSGIGLLLASMGMGGMGALLARRQRKAQRSL